MVCFPMSHYIFTQSHEPPYQNSGVYIKLDLEPLTYPVRQADLNYIDDCPLLPSSFLPQAGSTLTPWKSSRLYF